LGTRLGAALPKALVHIADCPLLIHTLRAFAESPLDDLVVVTVPPGFEHSFDGELGHGVFAKGWQHLGDVAEKPLIGPDYKHTLSTQLLAVLMQGVGLGVTRWM